MTVAWSKVKLVIFDLDGTLYEDTHHFEFYAEELSKKLKPEKRELFWNDYQSILKGNHPVAVGKIYDAKRDRILTVNPENNNVVKVFDWEGTELDEQSYYSGSLTYDFDHLIAIGDGWWLPVAAAKHYGVGSTYDSYCKTKDYMQTDEFTFADNPGLRETLLHLGEKKDLVLITNSQADDVERLLLTLKLHGVFPEVISSAKKPQNTSKHFQELLSRYHVKAEEAVSIGDNYLNEIAPAEQMNMQAILVDPTGKAEVRENTKVVSTLSELFEEIKAL
ncbi:HAD family hydrolase [Bacillus sp. FJAT-44742]|uniref:HAD family hydrolase n=1 Tax=Bacillus sp. FJAT-44742 TaxID=2014005 RepID=UPI000C232CE2|nr:HAD family hydrolase [Bacillus sp. FJAT-44742]